MRIFFVLLCFVTYSFLTPYSNAGVVGYATSHPGDDDLDNFIPFLEYLNNKVGGQHTIIFDTHERIRVKLLNGEVNIAILCPLNYIETKRRDINNKVRIIAKLEKHNSSYYQSSLVINKKFHGGSTDLASFKVLYPSLSSTSSYLYPISMMKEKGINVNNLIKEIEPEGKYKILNRIAEGEKAIAGVSNSTFDVARRKGVLTSNLYKITTSPKEIPYDAIVIYRDGETQQLYESAIASLFVEDTSDIVKKYLPQLPGITGLSYALDSDYDSLRSKLAMINGGGVFNIGLTLAMQPDTIHEKKENFRILQSKLFNDAYIFLVPKIYDKENTSHIIKDLIGGGLDIGELPPVFAGEAILKGLEPILSPTYNGNAYYNSVFIKSVNNKEINNGAEFFGKTIALSTKTSASSTIFPLKHLSDQYKIDKDDVTLLTNLSADEIITAVATGKADVGALAEFRLNEAFMRGHDYVEQVVTVPGINIRIPNGAYVISKSLSDNHNKVNFLRDEIQKASRSLGDLLEPSLAIIIDVDINKMVDNYSWANPKDRRPLVLILVATFILIVSAIMFTFIYRPHNNAESTTLKS